MPWTNVTPALTNSVNVFLNSDKEKQIRSLSQSADLSDQLNSYVYEAIRA
jgi:hypothetical protein